MTTPSRDLYALLGVTQKATPKQLKAAYRSAARRAHPDAGGTTEAFHTIQAAYACLSDKDRRRRYDATGDESTTDVSAEIGESVRFMLWALESVLASLRTPVKNADVCGMIRNALSHEIEQKIRPAYNQLKQRTEALTEFRKRLDVLQPGQENRFLAVTGVHLAQAVEQENAARRSLAAAQRALDELGNYESDYELVTMVYGLSGASSSAGQWVFFGGTPR